MKILKKDLKHGEVAIKVTSPDDLWYLSQLIEPGDLARGRTVRKIKLGEGDERKSEVIKKEVTITVRIEKVDLQQNSLRLAGIIIEAPEDIPRASHHTISLEENSIINIIKEHWLSYQLDRLHEAAEQKGPKLLICIFDRESAFFGLLKQQGYEILLEMTGDVEKKVEQSGRKENFYQRIISQLKEYAQRYSLDRIILASPAFWKEELLKELDDELLAKKMVMATCSSADRGSFEEVLKRPELKEVLRLDRIAKESVLVEKLLGEISKSGAASYGRKDSESAANGGAVDTLLVTDGLIHKARENNAFIHLDNIMKTVDRLSGKVVIINSENEPGRKLDGLGGIAALLRYKLNY